MQLYTNQQGQLVNEAGQPVDQYGRPLQVVPNHNVPYGNPYGQQYFDPYGQQPMQQFGAQQFGVSPYQDQDFAYRDSVEQFNQIHGRPATDGVRVSGASFREPDDHYAIDDNYATGEVNVPVDKDLEYSEQQLDIMVDYIKKNVPESNMNQELTNEDSMAWRAINTSGAHMIRRTYKGDDIILYGVNRYKKFEDPAFQADEPYFKEGKVTDLYSPEVGRVALSIDMIAGTASANLVAKVANVTDGAYHSKVGSDISSALVKSESDINTTSKFSNGILGKFYPVGDDYGIKLYKFSGADNRRDNVVLGIGDGTIQLGPIQYGVHFVFSEGFKNLIKNYKIVGRDLSTVDLNDKETALDYYKSVLYVGLPIPILDASTISVGNDYIEVNAFNILFYYGWAISKGYDVESIKEFVQGASEAFPNASIEYISPKTISECDTLDHLHDAIKTKGVPTKLETDSEIEAEQLKVSVPDDSHLGDLSDRVREYRYAIISAVIRKIGKKSELLSTEELESLVHLDTLDDDDKKEDVSSNTLDYLNLSSLHSISRKYGIPYETTAITATNIHEYLSKEYPNPDHILFPDADKQDIGHEMIKEKDTMFPEPEEEDSPYKQLSGSELIKTLLLRDEQIESIKHELKEYTSKLDEAEEIILDLKEAMTNHPSDVINHLDETTKIDEVLRIVRGIEDKVDECKSMDKVDTPKNDDVTKNETSEDKVTSIESSDEEIDEEASSVVTRLPLVIIDNLATESEFIPLDMEGIIEKSNLTINELAKGEVLDLVQADDILNISSHHEVVRNYYSEKFIYKIKNSELVSLQHNYLFTLSPRYYKVGDTIPGNDKWLTRKTLDIVNDGNISTSMTFEQAGEFMKDYSVMYNTTSNLPIDASKVEDLYETLMDDPTLDNLTEFITAPGGEDMIRTLAEYIGLDLSGLEGDDALVEIYRLLDLFEKYKVSTDTHIGYRFGTMILTNPADEKLLLEATPAKEVNYQLSGPMANWYKQVNSDRPIMSLVIGTRDYMFEIVGDTISRKLNYPQSSTRDSLRNEISKLMDNKLKQIADEKASRVTLEEKRAEEPIVVTPPAITTVPEQDTAVEYINGVPQPPIPKRVKTKDTLKDKPILGKHIGNITEAKKSIQTDAMNIERLLNNVIIEEPESFYAPFDPVDSKLVSLKERKQRIEEVIDYHKRVPALTPDNDWVDIFLHYIPAELVKIVKEAKAVDLRTDNDNNTFIVDFFEELGYSERLLKSARVSYVTGKPTESVFVTDDLIKMLESKIDLSRIDSDVYEETTPLGIQYLNMDDMGNGVSMIDNSIDNKLFEYHSRRLDMMKTEDLLNIFTTDSDIKQYNINVRELSPDELKILSNNNYRVMRTFDNSNRKNTLESHLGRQIHNPTDLLNTIISLKEMYDNTGQI